MQAFSVLSASLDGEAATDERERLVGHLAGCAACRDLAADLAGLQRATRVAPAPDVPDLTAAILATTAPIRREPGAIRLLRVVMALSALTLLVLAVPELLASANHEMHASASRHLGAFDLALGAGLALTAWRPQRSLSGFLPIATVLVGVCLAVTLSDSTTGIHLGNHVASIIGVGGAWMLEALALRGPDRRLRLAA